MEILIFIFPFLGFLIFQFPKLKIKAKFLYYINILLTSFTCIISVYIFLKILNLDKDLPVFFYPLLKFDDSFLDWSLKFDLFISGLIVLSSSIVLILNIYSINFFKDDKINFKIYSLSSLSIFSFVIFISSNNIIQFFLGWYLIILSSYLMSNISNKTRIIDNSNIFLHNRISDLIFFLSLYFIYSNTNSINFDMIFKSFSIFDHNYVLFNKSINTFDVITLTLFLSFLLRCRQFFIFNSTYDFLKLNIPFYILMIFALYMPAGLYFIFRFLPLTEINFDFLNIISILGCVLILIFSILLLRSYNLKKLIVYIGACQFGILLFVIGNEAYNVALFHFFTSTISLVIVGLGFGIIISKLNNEADIRKMGSLITKTPSIFLFILIGFVSLLGMPYFSGFFSNQLLLETFLLINKEFHFTFLMFSFLYTFVISYVSLKIIIIVFLSRNNCNIHLFNKIKDGSYHIKFILFLLSILIIFSGWYLNNIFSGSNAENLWRLVLLGKLDFSIKNDFNQDALALELRDFICFIGIFLAVFNYIIIPKLENNFKLKNNKLFKYYLKLFTCYHINK